MTDHGSRGFTLIELAIVTVILSLLLAGMLMPLSAQRDLQARQETSKALGDIREALLAFAAVNGRLPCPADGSLNADANPGREVLSAGQCARLGGVLPWLDLGVAELDAWGHRYSYHVTGLFAQAVGSTALPYGCTPADDPTQAAFALCSNGDMQVWTATTNGTALAASVPAVVISHGRNGFGAYTRQGTQIPAAAGDEGLNADPRAVRFYAGEHIDDLVTWLSSTLLMGRMLSAGRLP